MQDLPVKEIMTSCLITANTNDRLVEVAQIFKEQSFHHLPIINAEGCLEGIISLTDIERIKNGATLFRNPKIEEYNEVLFQTMLAKDVMTKGVVHLRPSDTIRRAYDIFKGNQFRALPIIEKGKLVGIITPLDMLDYFFQENK